MATTCRLDPLLAVVLLAALVPARAVGSAPGPEHAGRQLIGGPVVSNAGPPPAPAGRGWRHLSQGRFSQALYSFARQAAASPGAEPKVGYALSAASLGAVSRGVASMRRALRVDPESLPGINIDEDLQPTVQRLIERYSVTGSRDLHDRDRAFMIASLHYLLRDLDSAHTAIRLAIRAGDERPSTANLERVIEQELVDRARRDSNEQPTSRIDHQPTAGEVQAATAAAEESEAQLQEVLDALDELVNAALDLQRSLLKKIEPPLPPVSRGDSPRRGEGPGEDIGEDSAQGEVEGLGEGPDKVQNNDP